MKEIKIKGPEGRDVLFTDDVESTLENVLTVGLFGLEGTGKTRLACTAPEVVGVVPLDRKTRFTVAKTMKEFGRRVLMPKEDFIRPQNPVKLALMKEAEAKKYYGEHIARIKDAILALHAHKDVRTLVIDTTTQLWEDLMFKHFGRDDRIMPRDRGPVNQELIDLLNVISSKNVVLVHKATEIWLNDKPTGRFKAAGWGHIGYHVMVMAELVRATEKQETGEDGWRFGMNIKMCQANPDLQEPNGRLILRDEQITFPVLASLVNPDTDPEDWE